MVAKPVKTAKKVAFFQKNLAKTIEIIRVMRYNIFKVGKIGAKWCILPTIWYKRGESRCLRANIYIL